MEAENGSRKWKQKKHVGRISEAASMAICLAWLKWKETTK